MKITTDLTTLIGEILDQLSDERRLLDEFFLMDVEPGILERYQIEVVRARHSRLALLWLMWSKSCNRHPYIFPLTVGKRTKRTNDHYSPRTEELSR